MPKSDSPEMGTLNKSSRRCKKRLDYSAIVGDFDTSVIKNEPKSLRKKERVDYAAMLRGSSLGDPNKNDTSLKNKTCYREVEDDDEQISPSKVFEFDFDPLQETKVTQQAKKQAKLLKKVIREKIAKKHPKPKKTPLVMLQKLDLSKVVTPQGKINVAMMQGPTLQRLTFNQNMIKKPQSTPNQKEDEGDDNNNDNHNDDNECHTTNPAILEISQICDDFDDISNPNTSNTMLNQSIPWRAELPFITRRMPISLNTSRPAQTNNTLNTSRLAQTKNTTEYSLYAEKEKQTSIVPYLTKSNESRKKTVHFERSIGSTLSSNESSSSISDISQELIDKPLINRKSSMKKVNFDNAVTSSPQGIRRAVLGEKNIYCTKLGVIGKQLSVAVNEKENIVHINPNSETTVMSMQTSKEDSFFGFDISSSEGINNRKSKMPVRISLTDVTKVLKPQNKSVVPEESLPALPEQSVASLAEQENAEATSVTIFDDPAAEFLDEPRFTNYVNRSYTPYTRKRKKVIIDHSDHDEEQEATPKKRPKKITKKKTKHDMEFELWAKQFNSMCEDVEQEDLVVE